MSNYWAISIGINQYHYFQPLMQAQNDALGLHRFLVDDVGFDETHSVLLSDLSVSARHQAVYPDQHAILEWLRVVCQQKLGPEDRLWLFFSGYGAQADGDDYLMPVDGDPANVAKTGLKVRDLLEILQQAPTQNQVLILDMNRSQSALAGQQIGAQTIELAQAAGVPLLLSCQPDQFSHETLAVRHGLFTAALLEGLRYHGCFTLAHLSDYLKARLPELCEHHWRPVQHPVAVIPEDKKFMVLLPQAALESLQVVEPRSESGPLQSGPLLGGAEGAMGVDILVTDAPPEEISNNWREGETGLDETGLGSVTDLSATAEIDTLDFSLPESYTTEPDPTTTVDPPEDPVRSGPAGGQLRVWGLLVALLLLGGVAYRNLPFLQAAVRNLSLPEWATFDGIGSGGSPDSGSLEDPILAEDSATEADPSAEDVTPESGEAEAVPETDAETAAADTDTPEETPATEESTADADGGDSDGDASDETPIDPDRGLPIDDPDAGLTESAGVATIGDRAEETIDDPSTLIAASGNTSSNRRESRALLESARQSIEPNQASRFVEAIEIARRIQPGAPYYEEAQTDIARWSRVILDMAEGRAASGNLEGAISAAQLVPTDQPAVSRQAQQRIAFWQQRQRSRAVIREAQGIPRTGQANTYQEGIFRLQQVPAGQPEYASAQGLIDQWSQKMLSIAQARAAQGRNQAAIEAAALIPKGTAAHEQAQSDMQRWRGN